MITGSIVLYKSDLVAINKLINNFLQSTIAGKLFIIDNSPCNSEHLIISNAKVRYISNPSNPGFGAAHNIALKQAGAESSDFHFIINPDVEFEAITINKMVDYISNNPKVGMLMPKILNTDGTIQNLPKLLPNPSSILLRKFKRPKKIYERFIDKYELRSVNPDRIYKAPILSGCFTLLNMAAITEVGSYDDRFFMYFEDWDLSRRMAEKYDTIYFPEVAVYHGYESGANKNSKLFKIFIASAIHYFNKWGWFFDKDRKKLNRQTLEQFK